MAARDYPSDNADEPQSGPERSRPRAHGDTVRDENTKFFRHPLDLVQKIVLSFNQ